MSKYFLVFLFFFTTSVLCTEKDQKAYKELVEKSDLDNKPEGHARIAKWCKSKKLTKEYNFHLRAYNLHLTTEKRKFYERDGKLTIIEQRDLYLYAERLKLDDQHQKFFSMWIDSFLNEKLNVIYSTLKKIDSSKHQNLILSETTKLLKYSEKYNVHQVDAINKIAKLALKYDENHALAHRALGNILFKGTWGKPYELLIAKGDELNNRIAIHKASNSPSEKSYPSKPLKDYSMNKREACYVGEVRGYEGNNGNYFLTLPKSYSSRKKWPLIIELHGGGTGDYSAQENNALISMSPWATRYKTNAIVICPTAHSGNDTNRWGDKKSQLKVVDCIIKVSEEFNIDLSRIYITGVSMGGGGVKHFLSLVPDLGAAYCSRAGFYWNTNKVPNLTGIPIMVIHGEQDTEKRNKTLRTALDDFKKANATVQYVGLQCDHYLPPSEVYSRLATFCFKYKSKYEPNLQLIREIIDKSTRSKDKKRIKNKKR